MGARYRHTRRGRRAAAKAERRRPSDTPTLDAAYAAALHDEVVDFQGIGTRNAAAAIWIPFVALFRAVTRYTRDLEGRRRNRR